MRALYIFPALIFLLLAILMGWKILDDKQDMRATAQTTRDDPLPEISLPLLDGNATLSNASFHGKISLLHFFASWCVSCVSERQEWESLRNETAFQRIAVAWNDPPEKTRAWLKKYGNAFDQVAIDRAGKLGVKMGITGIPETLLVAPNGHVIWRWNAPLTQDIIQKDLMPLIERLKDAK